MTTRYIPYQLIIDYLERRTDTRTGFSLIGFRTAVELPKKGKVIEVHSSTTRWIGVDLNTTGHVAVAADPISGKVMKLGKNIHSNHSHSLKNCTKLWKEGKRWKLKRFKTRERKNFRTAINTISRQIVSFAESIGSGIKFEKLFSAHYTPHETLQGQYQFSFENGSFYSLQRLVEKRAKERGVEVLYVNPAFTSKRCSRCGNYGRRSKKRFECPHCGHGAHADVNAAFNIAASTRRLTVIDTHTRMEEAARLPKKQFIKTIRDQPVPDISFRIVTALTWPENVLAVVEQ